MAAPDAGRRGPRWLFLISCFLVALLAGCGGGTRYHGSGGGSARTYAPTHYYPPPGPPSDPWGPYIREAAQRSNIPAQWIRAVMRQESGGQEQAVSSVGAMGLLQLMPATYEQLRAQQGLGSDPFDPHNNILAGAAYIRQMYDRYGSPGFLAAYNAGPHRLDRYLAGEVGLPSETVHYVAAISPHLGNEIPMSGPLANYQVASVRPNSAPTSVSFATGCDVNAAYDPEHPCTSAMANQIARAEQSGCDPDAAYSPAHPCTPYGVQRVASAVPRALPAPQEQAAIPQQMLVPPQEIVQPRTTMVCDPDAAYDPAVHCIYPAAQPPAAQPEVLAPPRPVAVAAGGGGWAIQVGAFSTRELARSVAEGARSQLADMISNAAIDLLPATSGDGRVLYRARLTNLAQGVANNACTALKARQLPCIVVPAGA